jgi:Predicted glycosyltransferase
VNFYKIFKSGDEVRVKCKDGYFTSKIYKITGENSFMILQSGTFSVAPGDQYSLACITERGLYLFETEVIESVDVSIATEVKATGKISKLQRRSGFRVRDSLPVKALLVTNEPSQRWMEATTADISEGGIRLKFNMNCPSGQLMKLLIRINKYGMDVDLYGIEGKVVRCVKTKDEEFGYLLGIEFINLPLRARNEIIRFVILSQRSAMKETPFKRYQSNGERRIY